MKPPPLISRTGDLGNWRRRQRRGKKRKRAGVGDAAEYILAKTDQQLMVDAHLTSMSLLSAPFGQQGPYDFASQNVTEEVRKLIPVMLKHRLTPPPPETYSLNRKLSGAFLMCARLGAKVDCGKLWAKWAGDYETRKEESSGFV